MVEKKFEEGDAGGRSRLEAELDWRFILRLHRRYFADGVTIKAFNSAAWRDPIFGLAYFQPGACS